MVYILVSIHLRRTIKTTEKSRSLFIINPLSFALHYFYIHTLFWTPPHNIDFIFCQAVKFIYHLINQYEPVLDSAHVSDLVQCEPVLVFVWVPTCIDLPPKQLSL